MEADSIRHPVQSGLRGVLRPAGGGRKGADVGGAACMRTLVMVCYGVLKNRAPLDPAASKRKTG
jgi:hypothetical protein